MLSRLRILAALALLAPALAAPPEGAASATGVRASGSVREIESGLAYSRILQVPGDLPPASGPGRQAIIVDLRYIRAEQGAAAVFSTWLRARSRAGAVLILANRQTAPALLGLLVPGKLPVGAVTIGIAGGDFQPDIPVTANADTERAAYDALDAGTPLQVLIDPPMAKPRLDEASIGRPAAPAAKNAPATPAVLPDPVLQRAAQFYRALAALRKL